MEGSKEMTTTITIVIIMDIRIRIDKAIIIHNRITKRIINILMNRMVLIIQTETMNGRMSDKISRIIIILMTITEETITTIITKTKKKNTFL